MACWLIFLVVVINLNGLKAQYYPYPIFPFYPPPSHSTIHQQQQQQPTYYIVQGPPPPQPQPIYRTGLKAFNYPSITQNFRLVEVDGDSVGPSYAASPPATVMTFAPPPPQPQTIALTAPAPLPSQPSPPGLPYPGPTYIIASGYHFPQGAYPGGAILQGFQGAPMQVAPPYEKKQKNRVTSNRIA